jgi:hypothetical protein
MNNDESASNSKNSSSCDKKAIAKATFERLKLSLAIDRVRHYHKVRLFREGCRIVAEIGLLSDHEVVDVFEVYADEFAKCDVEQWLSLVVDAFDVGVNHGKSIASRKKMRRIMKKHY